MKLFFKTILVLVSISISNFAIAADSEESQKAVLVTGASSGIGLKITQVLASRGYFVYAGARKQKDLDALNKMENVQSIKLDVTKQGEIDAAVITIEKAGRGLYGLVNNAGVVIRGPLIETKESDLAWLMDVNVMGPFRITNAFAPMIIDAKGRITNIGSISGTLSGRFIGAYSMSKHAIEAYTDSLNKEMTDFGVHVSVIEPGNYRSKIALSAGKRAASKSQSFAGSRYKEEMEAMANAVYRDRSQFKEPDEVAEAAMHALFDGKPKLRYMVVPNANEGSITLTKQMTELVQLNDWQAYSLSREQLIEMLDKAMKTE